jgi:CheY-like chemotaxis protein
MDSDSSFARLRAVRMIGRATVTEKQMPIVDGFGSTKMIREHALASGSGRVPIFAVSASLMERDRQSYVECGFDGWIMKPIDFQRVNRLLKGVRAGEARNESVYQPGSWEKGGWFEMEP